MEIIPNYVSEKDITEESNRRAAKAGYCSKNGEPLHGTGKIWTTKTWGEAKYNTWPRDAAGNLID